MTSKPPPPPLSRKLGLRAIDINDESVVVQQYSKAAAQNHLGNIYFNELVHSKLKSYYSTTSFNHKKAVREEIYQQVLEKGGTFYRFQRDNIFYEMDKKEVFGYIAQRFRHARPKNGRRRVKAKGSGTDKRVDSESNKVVTAVASKDTATSDAESNEANLEDSYTVEKATLSDKDFEVTSVVPTTYNDTKELASFLFVATVLEEMANSPMEWFEKHFYKICPSTYYIKTRRAQSARDYEEHCPTLALSYRDRLVEAVLT